MHLYYTNQYKHILYIQNTNTMTALSTEYIDCIKADVATLRYNMEIRKSIIDEYQGEIEEHESAIRTLKRKIAEECDIYDDLHKRLEKAEDIQLN